MFFADFVVCAVVIRCAFRFGSIFDAFFVFAYFAVCAVFVGCAFRIGSILCPLDVLVGAAAFVAVDLSAYAVGAGHAAFFTGAAGRTAGRLA